MGHAGSDLQLNTMISPSPNLAFLQLIKLQSNSPKQLLIFLPMSGRHWMHVVQKIGLTLSLFRCHGKPHARFIYFPFSTPLRLTSKAN